MIPICPKEAHDDVVLYLQTKNLSMNNSKCDFTQNQGEVCYNSYINYAILFTRTDSAGSENKIIKPNIKLSDISQIRDRKRLHTIYIT